MKNLNKKGFTLVELLAVIVILAVVMLIAVTAVGPLMAKSRKSALGTEGIGLVDAAKTAFQAEQLKGTSSVIQATSSVCFDLEWLKSKGYFSKGTAEKYNGSVLITYANTNGGTYTYKFWISNGTYVFADADPANYDVDNGSTVTDGATANKTCGKTVAGGKIANHVYCTGTTCVK